MSATKGSIEAIDLDMSLDDIEDLPGFVSFPTGAYIVKLEKGFEKKIINDHPFLEMAMTLNSIEELDESKLDEGEVAPKKGDVATQSFALDNEYGIGNMKIVMKPIAESAGVNKIVDVIEASKGMELLVVVKRRKGKKGTDNEDKNFMNIVKVAIL